ncbi:hypothetical protein Hypma_014894 [Hypsizygus marmoreus]|uniref:DUF2415 domain-containing protein n=1 Tax=Hypsizygus marmoreus TaxID=39966 RepID=A0A369K775_HYPMA|nr:hypothetical protein Hypma_014894 [Hypsizygus marmoreus]
MARDPSLLTSKAPTTLVPASVLIGHVQLRDLIICPREWGLVNYVEGHAIMEHNIHKDLPPRPLVKLSFIPNTLAALPIEGTDDTLLAAGGQDAEIHLSYHSPISSRHRRTAAVWHTECAMTGSINNSVLLTSMSLTRSNESSVEPRIGISNNDCTVKFYNIPIRGPMKRNVEEVGGLRLNVPVNHSSISPDGRTLLSVGDSAKVYLHQMTGGARITFSPIATLKLPSPTIPSLSYSSASLTASFSTAFSSNGLKFAVASQEGLVAVWDVRSSKPMKVFQTEKTRMPAGNGNGSASGWLVDEIFDWTGNGSSKPPGWSVRNVKFGGSGNKEIMTFTEHTSFLHVVDARTFETEQIVQVPAPTDSATGEPRPPQNYRHARPAVTPRPRYVPSPARVTPLSPPHSAHGSPRHQSQPQILQALGDTFRIASPYSPPSSISDSTWRALRMADPAASTSTSAVDDNHSDILVIPRLGDASLESDVQALLGSHGIPSRPQSHLHIHDDEEEGDNDPNTGSTHADYEYTPRPVYAALDGGRRAYVRDEDMEVDELESDCASSHTPSRSSSPSPSTHLNTPGLRRGDTAAERQVMTYPEDLDIAGTCFDPSGRFIYVASTKSVAEWGVRGADKRWWSGSQWM